MVKQLRRNIRRSIFQAHIFILEQRLSLLRQRAGRRVHCIVVGLAIQHYRPFGLVPGHHIVPCFRDRPQREKDLSVRIQRCDSISRHSIHQQAGRITREIRQQTYIRLVGMSQSPG